MTYNYVVTNQKPTTVTHALTASFTSADALNLLLIRSTRLEVQAMGPEGLVPVSMRGTMKENSYENKREGGIVMLARMERGQSMHQCDGLPPSLPSLPPSPPSFLSPPCRYWTSVYMDV